VGPLQGGLAAGLLAAACAAQACDVPGDGSSLRRALLRVKYLPETERWANALPGPAAAHYLLSLDAPRRHEGRCYWPIEARSGDRLWLRFYATPRGEDILVEAPDGRLLPLEAWRRLAR
jgi:hypothetical protein